MSERTEKAFRPRQARILLSQSLGNRLPPFVAAIAVSEAGDEVRLTSRGSAQGHVCIAAGAVFFMMGLGMLVVGFGPTMPSPPEMWIPLSGVGCVMVIAGAWLCRFRHECVIDVRTWRVTVRVRGAFGSTERHIACDECRLRLHSVSLHRRTPLPSWHGNALCLWCDDELLMVVAATRDAAECARVIERSRGVLDRLYDGEGGAIDAWSRRYYIAG